MFERSLVTEMCSECIIQVPSHPKNITTSATLSEALCVHRRPRSHTAWLRWFPEEAGLAADRQPVASKGSICGWFERQWATWCGPWHCNSAESCIRMEGRILDYRRESKVPTIHLKVGRLQKPVQNWVSLYPWKLFLPLPCCLSCYSSHQEGIYVGIEFNGAKIVTWS